MRKSILSVQRFLKDESGPTTVEYAVMLNLIVLAAVSGVKVAGDTTLELFEQTKETMPQAATS